jgi:tetratricopeptide (TPR) repeat protein
LRCDPDNPDIAAMHAASLERSGDDGAAREVVAHVLAQDPGHARSLRLLAHIERRAGRFEPARDLLVKHLKEHPSAEDWRLRYELAPVLDRLGEHAEAIRHLSLAKHQLHGQSQTHHREWRTMTERQWQVTRLLDSARLAAWQRDAASLDPRFRLCLMGGFPRSGTTLLEQVLASHPDCLGTDETGILSNQFRNPLVLAAASAAEAVAELDAMEPADLGRGRAEYLRCTEDRLGEALDGRILLEKDPLLTADLAVPLRLFPDAKILMPLRDPRDVVVSFFFTIVPLAPNSVASANLGDACRYYAEVMRHGLWLRERLAPDRWMESRYEDLLAQPEPQTRRLASFLGIDWSPDMLAHHRQPRRKAVGTPTYDDVSKPLYTRSLGRWKNYERWLDPHLHHLEPFLGAFGY